MVPVHYKCTDASRNLTGYMSRPPGEAGPPLPMAPPPVPEPRPWSSTDIVVPSSVPVMKPPPKAPPVVPFTIWHRPPREVEVVDPEAVRLLVTKVLSAKLRGITISAKRSGQ